MIAPQTASYKNTLSAREIRAAEKAGRARDAIISALRRGRPGPRGVGHPPNSLRDRWIASTVAVVCMDAQFASTRNSATDTRACGCSIVAKALGELGIKLSEKRVRDIWDKHARTYDRLLRR